MRDGSAPRHRALRYGERMKASTRETLLFIGAVLLVLLVAAGPKLWWLLREKGWLGAG